MGLINLIYEYFWFGQTSYVEIKRLRSEIESLKVVQGSIQSELHAMSLVEAKEQKVNYWKWIIGSVVVIGLGVGIVYLFSSQTDAIFQALQTLSDEQVAFTKSVIDRISKADRISEQSNVERAKILTEALNSVESRLSSLMNRLSDQISRSQDRDFSAHDFFSVLGAQSVVGALGAGRATTSSGSPTLSPSSSDGTWGQVISNVFYAIGDLFK